MMGTYQPQGVQVSNNLVLGFCVIVTVVQVLGKYMLNYLVLGPL